MNILVTGGAGYIGSHTSIELLKKGHDVIIADNLSNSKKETINRIENISKKKVVFYQIDVNNIEAVTSIFSRHSIDAVIHFAGFKSVGESVQDPLKYYYNNVLSTILLSQECLKYGVNKFIFSSSATVYGNSENVPFTEDQELLPTTNPYGESKAMSERILRDVVKSNPKFSVAILRYFNPAGAHETGLIGEMSADIPNNLMPYITSVAKGNQKKLNILGNNYKTVDGTGVRDYIHVMDLAQGHIAALNYIKPGTQIYNLGTGKGTSVLQLLRTFEKANKVLIPYEYTDRRLGDIAECYADVSKAEQELKWKAKKGVFDICKDTWNFETNGY
jgi:UDP-glucose 4-epimerase